MLPIEELLRDVDRAWTPANAHRVTLHVFGSTALMLQADYLRGTSDSDVLETKELDHKPSNSCSLSLVEEPRCTSSTAFISTS